MHETTDDLDRLQRLLDESHREAGGHLRNIVTDDRRVDAGELVDLLTGVQVLVVATVTASCEPLVGPVDGLFFRGRFHFGSGSESVRARHLRARPQVSAAHTRGEDLAVVVHGRAVVLDMEAEEQAPFRRYLEEVYGDWEEWGLGAFYARIEPRRIFAFGGFG